MPQTFKAGGREFVLLPFTIALAEQILDKSNALAKAAGAGKSEEIGFMCEATALALRRGNVRFWPLPAAAAPKWWPRFSAKWIRFNVELPELRPLFDAVMEAGGTRRTEPGEAQSP